MKKKVFLGAAAIALTASLAIGGTLMLFTATTETAENKADLAKLTVELWEKGGTIYRNGVEFARSYDYRENYDLVDGTGFKGINYSRDSANKAMSILPGDTMDKVPHVKNTSDTDVYVKVEGAIVLDATASTAANFTSLKSQLAAQSATSYNDLFSLVDDGFNTADWYVGGTTYKEDGNVITVTRTWYYVSRGTTTTLKSVAAGDKTTDIFNKIILNKNWDNAFNGVKMNLNLTGLAVQTANNIITTGPDTWAGIGWPVK